LQTVKQSSTHTTYVATNATSESTSREHFAFTNSEKNPWFQLDLGSVREIDEIELVPYDSKGSHLTPLHVFASVQPLNTDLDTAKTEPRVAYQHFPSTTSGC